MPAQKEFRARFKGKFNTAQVNTANLNWIKDRDWMKKANPLAAQAETDYFEKDKHYLYKRRF